MDQKHFRRIVGFVAVQLQKLRLDEIEDLRSAKGRRWQMKAALSGCLLGLMSGCKSLAEVERLTAKLSRPIRRLLGIGRRLPDTTLRDILCGLPERTVLDLLQRAVSAARRGKSLECVELPFHMAAMDGKVTWTPSWDGRYAQKHEPEEGLPYGLLRTVTTTLVTARGKPCIGVSPIPASTNEMGHFQTALDNLDKRHGGLPTLVSYDQGANSEENARAVLQRDMHYLFRLNDERRHMQQLAMELLDTTAAIAQTVDVISNSKEHIRRLQLFEVNQGKLPPLVRKSELWEHTRTLLCIEWEARKDDNVVERERRYFASSLPADKLSAAQWLWAARAHWGVETTHQILDVSFKEDDHPWIRNDPHGMLIVAILRRIAYTLLTLYRSVTQRSEEKRQVPWAELFESVRDTLIASTEVTVAALRKRKALDSFAAAG
jgi:hypothetical protein